MNSSFTRRNFLKAGGGAMAFSALVPAGFSVAEEKAAGSKRDIKKAIMYATVGVNGSVLEKFKTIKEAGFAGVETMSHMDQAEVLKARDEVGLHIPSVCCQTHWELNLASPDASVRQKGLDGLKQALKDAQKYGASSVLFVPGTVNQDISYGDAYARSQEEIHKVLPLAEEMKVKIAIENVWNNFLLSPLEMARYIDDFKSPWIGAHFDIGNVLRYGWPEQWIEVLGKRIQKLHIKEFSRKKMQSEGLRKGFDVDLLEGDDNWPVVMKALDGIGYSGWAMAEQRGGNTPEGLQKISSAMDKIFAL